MTSVVLPGNGNDKNVAATEAVTEALPTEAPMANLTIIPVS